MEKPTFAVISTISGRRTVYGNAHEAEVAAEWITKETGVLMMVLPLEDAILVEETLTASLAGLGEYDSEYLSATTMPMAFARIVAIKTIQRTKGI